MNIAFKQITGTATLAQIGEYELTIDRPPSKGGGGAGPMGGQALLAGVGGCFASTLFGAAQARDLTITGLELNLSARLSETVPKRFESIRLDIVGGTCSDPGAFEKLIRIAEKGCISINTIKQGLSLSVEM